MPFRWFKETITFVAALRHNKMTARDGGRRSYVLKNVHRRR